MAEFPSLPLWTDAWIADTKHLTRTERDIYLHLLILMWRTPGTKVPAEGGWLLKRLDIREKDETEMLSRIVSEFCISDGNRIWQKRLLKEFQYCQRQSVRRKGKKNKEKSANRNAAPDYAPIPIPIPIPTIEDKEPSGSLSAPPRRMTRDKSTRGTRLSPDWEPSAEDRQFAIDRGLDPENAVAEFRDYWCAVPGAKGIKIDWSATYRNNCRRISNGTGGGRPQQNRPSPPSIVAAFGRVIARAERS